MSKLTCDVIFYKNLKWGYTTCMNVPIGEALSEATLAESVEIGRITNVTIDIKDDTTLDHIEILKKEKQDIGAKAQVQINNIEDQIQSLLAIECDS